MTPLAADNKSITLTREDFADLVCSLRGCLDALVCGQPAPGNGYYDPEAWQARIEKTTALLAEIQ